MLIYDPKSLFDFLVFGSSGGVVMASRDGKIVFENTLDARLDVAFRKKLPEVFTHDIFLSTPILDFATTL